MTKKDTNFLRKYNDILQELSEDSGLDESAVENVVDHFFHTMKDFITDPRMPTIKITNLGTFRPSIGKINWQIRNTLYHYRKGNITRKRAVTKISHLWKVKQRLIKEKMGDITWKEWESNKDICQRANQEGEDT